MELKTKLLLTQLMLQNLISLIQAGNQEAKDVMAITLNSIGLSLNLIIFCFEYTKQRENFINILTQINIIVELEILFYNVGNLTNYFSLIYILNIENVLKKYHKGYSFITHTICLYVSIRLTSQFYVKLATSDFILFVLWQPLNHLIFYKDNQEIEIKQPNSALMSPRQAIQNAQFSYAEQIQQNLIDDKTPRVDQHIKVAIDEDLLNCLPYGLALIDKNFQVINHNEKLMSYLMISETDQIMNNLDQLLSNAELNSIKTSPHTKHKPHIVPLRKLKQNSAKHYERSTGTTNKTNWLSDRLKVDIQNKGSFQSSINDTASYSYIQFVMNEFLTKSHRQLNPADNLSIASDQTHMFKFHVVKDLKIRKKHFQIKVYEVKLQTKTKETAFLFIIENITNKEELKELTHRFKFQQALLNSFSHELRTPLNTSLPLLQILSQKIDETLNDNYLQLAIISCRRLLFQINDILDYAQIECEDFKLNLNKFYASEIFNDLKGLFKQECSQKQIELIVNFNDQIVIHSDKLRITQILVNLLNNSIKFTKQGGRIVLSLKKKEQQCIFSVWDNGEGISSDQMLQLQNQYNEQPKESNKMGLGLKVSQCLVKFLGGDGELQIKSQKGFYTVVSFSIEESVNQAAVKDQELFLQDIQELESDSKNSAQKVYISSRKFLNHCECNQILIVDDVPFNHITLMALLQTYGYKSDSAYDGDSGIKKVKQRLLNVCCKIYKIIFMDIEMPGKNGFVASSEISRMLQNERQKSIIVMCSAYNGQENAEQARQSGMSEIISKPISLDSLQTLLGKCFC